MKSKDKKTRDKKTSDKKTKRRGALSIELIPSLLIGDNRARFASHQKTKVHRCQTCRGKKGMIGPASSDVRK